MKRCIIGCFLILGLLITSTVSGDTTIVDENFDSYPSWDADPSQTAFHAAWRPDNGDGIVSMFSDPTEAGFVVPNNGGFLNSPNDNPPGVQGNAITLNTATHESTESFSLMPSETQWIKYGGDIFNDGPITNDSPFGMRQTIGLRNDTFDRDPNTPACECGVNFLEMGFYNTTATDPRTGEEIVSRHFQYRIALFSLAPPPDDIALPNWLSFQFDPALDVVGPPAEDGDYNDDDLVSAADYVVWRKNEGTSNVLPNDPTGGEIGQAQYDTWLANFGAGTGDIVDINDIYNEIEPVNLADEDPNNDTADPNLATVGWHRFSALIKPDSVTVEVDLFRDGINNATGEPGVDASDTWALQMNTGAGLDGAFTSLRFGGPSGSSPNDQAVFDNIFLMTIDPPVGGSGSSLGVVPEPASLVLISLALTWAIGVFGRRRGQ